VQNIHTAEDMAESTFVELMIKRPKFSGKSTFKTWLYAIGRNITAKHLRKHSKLSVVPLESQEYLTDEKNVENEYIKSEQKRLVHQALHSLKPDYRQVLYLIYFEGFTKEETALIMKKRERQIKDLIYNSRKALKTELERRGFEYEEL
jgi:RNA polymerase sigma-70 factor (ECF subfamily)